MNARIDNVRAEVKKGVFPSLKLKIYVSHERNGRYPDLQLLLATVKLTLHGDCIAASEPLLFTKNFESNINL